MLNFNKQNLDIKVLVEIEFSSTRILFFSNKHCIVSDKFYEGRIISDIVVDEKLQSFDRPIAEKSSVQIEFSNLKSDNTTGFFDDLQKAHNFYNKDVTIWVGDGTDKTNDYIQQFKGVISFPDGIIRHDRNVFAIEVSDIREKNDVIIPKEKFTITKYPNMEEKSIGKYIPTVYGEWGTIQLGSLFYPRVIAVCIDITINKFLIANHSIVSIDGIYRNGILLVDGTDYSSANFDLNNATFILDDYEENTETITIDCRGKETGEFAVYGADFYGVGDYGSSGDLIENPITMMKDMLTNLAEVDTDNLDTNTFNTLTTEFSTFKARRQLSEGIVMSELLAEMCFELGLVLKFTDGKYSLHNFFPDFTWDLINPKLFDSTDIVENSFSIEQDSERIYGNRVTARYSFHPGSVASNEEDKFLRIFYNSDFESIDNVGATYEQVFNFKWLFQDTFVSELVNDYLRFFGTEPIEIVNVQFMFRALSLELNDIIRLTYSKYEERHCKVVGLNKNLNKGIITARLYAFPDITHSGLYSDETESFPTYLGGATVTQWNDDWTEEQRRYAKNKWCFYCDDAGYISPGKEDSKDIYGYG